MGRKNQIFDVVVTNNPLLKGVRGRVTRSQISGVRARMETGELMELGHDEFDYLAEDKAEELKLDEGNE